MLNPENRRSYPFSIAWGRELFARMNASLSHWNVPPLDRGWLVAAASFVALPAMAAGPVVHWATEQLSVKAHGEPLGTVLREVALQTGVAIKGGDGLEEPVASSFTEIPLVDGLRRLLAGQNYLIVEEPRKNPKDLAVTRVVVLASLGSPASSPVPPAVQSRPMALSVESVPTAGRESDGHGAALRPPAPPAPERGVMDGDPAVRIEAVEALGRRVDASSLALIRGALSDPSEAVRAVAVEALNTRGSSPGVADRPGH